MRATPLACLHIRPRLMPRQSRPKMLFRLMMMMRMMQYDANSFFYFYLFLGGAPGVDYALRLFNKRVGGKMESGVINFNLYQSHYGKMRVLARHRLNPFTCMVQDYVYLSVVNAIRFFPSRA